ncbi:abortive infection family protein [bacterium]|nr:abortive infection family protein [bacterium]
MNEQYDLLKARSILDILIGDTSFGQIKVSENDNREVRCGLPYLTGTAICEAAGLFSAPVMYGSSSRWVYMCQLIDWCIEHSRISDLLHYLFSKARFSDVLHGFSAEEVNLLHGRIISEIISQINGYLSFSDNELVLVGNVYYVKSQHVEIPVETPSLDRIDREYIRQLIDRAFEDISNGNNDSAITKARTLIEEIFCYAIEQQNCSPSGRGDITRLYNQVKDLYNMHQNRDIDRRISDLLSGLNKIVDAISNMRNVASDSHGLGARRIAISDYHTRLVVGAAAVFSEFMLSVVENAQ